MTTPESAAPMPRRRPFQFSLRSLFGLTCGTAAFFSLARTLGYVDAAVILAGVVVTVGIMEYPRRVHLPTGIVVTLVAGTLLWLNLTPTKWKEQFHEVPPDYLDPVSKAMFWRGWPVGPWMICWHQNLSVRRGGQGAIIFDGVFFVIVLFAARVACEWCVRKCGTPISETPLDTPPSQNDTPPDGAVRGADGLGRIESSEACRGVPRRGASANHPAG